MEISSLFDRFKEFGEAEALVWHENSTSYSMLLQRLLDWESQLDKLGVVAGAVVGIRADFSPYSISLLLALAHRGCIVAPLSHGPYQRFEECIRVGQISIVFTCIDDDWSVLNLETSPSHHLLLELARSGKPGLIFFSSGSSGESKATLHDLSRFLESFFTLRPAHRSLAFLLFDHVGGINTLLRSLSTGGCLVILESRAPSAVCDAIERFKVEVLSTTPTFLGLLLLSCRERLDYLESLSLIQYGAEVMPPHLLTRLTEALPAVKFRQTYGLSEIGILRAQPRSEDSSWIALSGAGLEIRVNCGLLEIKANSTMLGYLNAETPFTDDGWLKTGDAVEVDGEYVRILGRQSELINVGGAKVYPAEVENVLLQMNGVEAVLVTGEPHPMIGTLVTAKVQLAAPEPLDQFRARMRRFCKAVLADYKVPQKIEIVDRTAITARFKKERR